MGSDMEFIIRGQAFIYIINNRGHKIDPWETPCFSVPQLEKKILVVLGYLLQLSVFC
jgi:hypothetical protein